ncbi:hypothetical protein JCM10908_001107 [Rhodotorula pacifica]|uniref:uncharacterized protein n=1 Tax=Rhodotorula pacifica TaxID=1495444 RepID=UPI00317FF457
MLPSIPISTYRRPKESQPQLGSRMLSALDVTSSPRDEVAFNYHGLPSPVSPTPTQSFDFAFAATVVNPRLDPSALAVTLSPPLPLLKLSSDPFERLPSPSPWVELPTPPSSWAELPTPPTSSHGWPATLSTAGEQLVAVERAPRTFAEATAAPHEYPPYERAGLLHEPVRPVSPALVASGLAAFQGGFDSFAHNGLRIFLGEPVEPEGYYDTFPIYQEHLRSVSVAAPPARFPTVPLPAFASEHEPPRLPAEPVSSDWHPPHVDSKTVPLQGPRAEARPPENVTPFMWKLIKLLEADAYAPWIQWDASGRHVLIALTHPRFLAVLGLFHAHSSVKSFVRQLHIYGFRRAPPARLPSILDCVDTTAYSDSPHPESYSVFFHSDFTRLNGSAQVRMLEQMRPGGQASRPSISARYTRSRAARAMS